MNQSLHQATTPRLPRPSCALSRLQYFYLGSAPTCCFVRFITYTARYSIPRPILVHYQAVYRDPHSTTESLDRAATFSPTLSLYRCFNPTHFSRSRSRNSTHPSTHRPESPHSPSVCPPSTFLVGLLHPLISPCPPERPCCLDGAFRLSNIDPSLSRKTRDPLNSTSTSTLDHTSTPVRTPAAPSLPRAQSRRPACKVAGIPGLRAARRSQETVSIRPPYSAPRRRALLS